MLLKFIKNLLIFAEIFFPKDLSWGVKTSFHARSERRARSAGVAGWGRGARRAWGSGSGEAGARPAGGWARSKFAPGCPVARSNSPHPTGVERVLIEKGGHWSILKGGVGTIRAGRGSWKLFAGRGRGRGKPGPGRRVDEDGRSLRRGR